MSGQLHPTFVPREYILFAVTSAPLFLSQPRAIQGLVAFYLLQFYPSSPLRGYSVLISVTKTVCFFIVTFKLRDRTVFTAKRIYLVGHVLFRKRKIHCVNLSSGKFISFQYFSSFSFNLITLRKNGVVLNIVLMDFSFYILFLSKFQK